MKSIKFLEDRFFQKNLNLSILEPEPQHEGGLLTLKRDGLAEARYQAQLQPCLNPTCSCRHIQFQCVPVPSEGDGTASVRLLEFWIDPLQREVVMTAALKEDSEALRLAKELAAILTDDDWDRLWQWFRVSKLELTQNASPSDIDIEDLPDVGNGLMIPFIEVFPGGLAFYFEMEGEVWAAEEHYCVEPDCDCKSALLAFLKLRNVAGVKVESLKDNPGIGYNYGLGEAGEVFPGGAGSPRPALLLAALKEAWPSLNPQMEKRNLLMRGVYARHYLAQALSLPHFLMPRTSQAVSTKVGRNERCPCGSGKKFKHCCLRAS